MSGTKESRAPDRGAVRLKKIGKYELMGKIAQGGMGALYKARHPTLQRTVLLKKLALEGGEGIIERFRREARLMMDLNSERIVQVFDHFKEGSHYYIVEEFVDGISLDTLIHRERYLSNDAATVILYEVCRALKFAHDRQVIHRDIKPGNILISNQGEVKLADFGIATSTAEADGLTKDGTMLGTPAYIPPEQIEDARNVDHRADIYSIGVVLYEMLTGKTPYPGSFTAETIRLIHRGKYVPPRRLNPRASRFLSRIVATCMRVKPKRRYQDLGVLIRLLEKRISRRDTTSVRRAVRKILKGEEVRDLFRGQRSRLFWPLAAAFVACLLAAGGFHLYRQGAWYEYFEARRYGALVISARIDSDYKEPGDIFFRPVLYREKGNDLTRVAGIDFGISDNPSRRTGDTYDISTRRLYLEAGRYRVKVSLEGQLYWISFTLSPRSEQRKALTTLDAHKIIVRQQGALSIPLTVRYAVFDADTGNDITAAAKVMVSVNDHWLPLFLARAEGLTPGRTYRFRVQEDGYATQVFDLIISPYQAFLMLEAHLVHL
ncbi:MAG TPA: serine/threonine-protein kinase [Spirochaetia bacterium]|nr:serine/threonine-protein kinase [Spirochaetia bacterium]